jgi:hypothetical protein
LVPECIISQFWLPNASAGHSVCSQTRCAEAVFIPLVFGGWTMVVWVDEADDAPEDEKLEIGLHFQVREGMIGDACTLRTDQSTSTFSLACSTLRTTFLIWSPLSSSFRLR